MNPQETLVGCETKKGMFTQAAGPELFQQSLSAARFSSQDADFGHCSRLEKKFAIRQINKETVPKNDDDSE